MAWTSWNQVQDDGGSFEFVGMGGMGYGGTQYMTKKPGGVSALWILGSGPALLGNNHDVMYSNTLWGRVEKPLFKKWAANVDPQIVSSSYADASFDFDPATRQAVRRGTIPHTPLRFVRETRFADDHVQVNLTLTADAAINLAELYEAIPLNLEGHEIVWSPDGKGFSFLDKNDKGMLVEFDRSWRHVTAPPLRYRPEAAQMGGVSLALPTTWKQGQTLAFGYQIKTK